MLTRLKVHGFKNLVNVDILFGPFTCIAGPNAAGKSNLFDAITFLSALADRPLLDAASSVRSQAGPSGDIRRLFHHVGDDFADEISFECEMIVPPDAIDDLGQQAKASITFLRYKLTLGYRRDESVPGGLEVRSEELQHINRRDAKKFIRFPFTHEWASTTLTGRRSGRYFISTETDDAGRVIELHQDRGTGGRNRKFAARQLPRTVLSTANAAESPTALVARREMQSWKLLQLEPTALRAPDTFRAPTRINANGGHLPATLARLARAESRGRSLELDADIYAAVANRLAELTEGVRSIRIDEDHRRELLTLIVTDFLGTEHEARALSDGTLRFLALAVLAEDPEAQGLICLEEPENGIHATRIPAMLRMLRDLAVEPSEKVGPDNPLRQVIVNTHSPMVVSIVEPDTLVLVRPEVSLQNARMVPVAAFRWLEGTWRDSLIPGHVIAKGDLLPYLNPAAAAQDDSDSKGPRRPSRVIDVPDLRQLALFPRPGVEQS
ncbi:MAG: AAA family ATPase [Chloroflexi bacterium]|nr:AAA family ATPase [Chloroflexota bacterium]